MIAMPGDRSPISLLPFAVRMRVRASEITNPSAPAARNHSGDCALRVFSQASSLLANHPEPSGATPPSGWLPPAFRSVEVPPRSAQFRLRSVLALPRRCTPPPTLTGPSGPCTRRTDGSGRLPAAPSPRLRNRRAPAGAACIDPGKRFYYFEGRLCAEPPAFLLASSPARRTPDRSVSCPTTWCF